MFKGVLFIAFCLLGLIFINVHLILVDSYQRLEEQNAIQMMKGSISVTSKVGEETTFVVTLPIEEIAVSESVLRLTT